MTDSSESEQTSILDRLRRRKVVQWGVAYAAGAWGFLQGLGYLGATFDWPREVQQLATIALLIGLPVVLVLAWYHGDRGRQRVSATELLIITLLFAIGGGLFWRFQHGSTSTAPGAAATESSATAATPGAAADRSVAVLPFVNFSSEPDSEYFADGLTEEILNSLTQAGDLRVAGRTSSFAFKGKNEDLRRVGQTLGVATVLEGSVRRAGDRVRITTQLIRVSDGFHLWSKTYDRTLNDVFQVQLDIAQNVASVLEVVVDDAQRQRMQQAGVKNPEAFIAFQKGRALFEEAHAAVTRRPMTEILEEANVEFARATQLEPDISEAYLLATDLYGHRLQRFDRSDAERRASVDSVRQELEKASQSARDPRMRLLIDMDRQLYSDDWSGLAVRARELAGMPGCGDGNWSVLIATYGLADVYERIEANQRRCDPLDDNGWTRGMVVASVRGGPEAVLELAQQVPAEIGPSRWRYVEQVQALAAVGRIEEARAIAAQLAPGTAAYINAMLIVSMAEGRPPAEVRAQLAELMATLPANAPNRAYDITMAVNLYAGDREANNRLAASIDARPGGPLMLLGIAEGCARGAAWDIDRTPNFKRHLEEAGLKWPPRNLVLRPGKQTPGA